MLPGMDVHVFDPDNRGSVFSVSSVGFFRAHIMRFNRPHKRSDLHEVGTGADDGEKYVT